MKILVDKKNKVQVSNLGSHYIELTGVVAWCIGLDVILFHVSRESICTTLDLTTFLTIFSNDILPVILGRPYDINPVFIERSGEQVSTSSFVN